MLHWCCLWVLMGQTVGICYPHINQSVSEMNTLDRRQEWALLPDARGLAVFRENILVYLKLIKSFNTNLFLSFRRLKIPPPVRLQLQCDRYLIMLSELGAWVIVSTQWGVNMHLIVVWGLGDPSETQISDLIFIWQKSVFFFSIN